MTVADTAKSLLAELDRYQSLHKPGIRDTIATPGFVVNVANLRALAESALTPDDVTITVTESAGSDGARLVIIDTDGEPDGSDGSRPLRVLVNDGTVYEGVPYIHDHTKED